MTTGMDELDDTMDRDDEGMDELDEEMDAYERLMDESRDLIRAKGMINGTTTLSAAAQRLRGWAEELEAMEREGWQLEAPVDDDYGFIRQDLGAVTPTPSS
jgi:hypothetical protein